MKCVERLKCRTKCEHILSHDGFFEWTLISERKSMKKKFVHRIFMSDNINNDNNSDSKRCQIHNNRYNTCVQKRPCNLRRKKEQIV